MKMRRKIITIDQEKCNGCGICISSCPEGALQLIDGKARLVGDLLCDGLGACLKECPQDAISVEEREAEAYDEIKVLKNILPQGPKVLLAHLKHLRDHGQTDLLQQALNHLKNEGIPIELPTQNGTSTTMPHACPGSQNRTFTPCSIEEDAALSRPSQLTHWPIQLHLISPMAPQYRNSDLLVAADCTAFSNADFHNKFLQGHSLVIACPKLDANQEIYRDKLIALIDQAEVKSIKVMIMQVPCCGGLLRQVIDAAKQATHKPPIQAIVVGLQGEILSETSL
jgi:NAD-dependent dihydropyrimidine dehydrogenase PreA subunit